MPGLENQTEGRHDFVLMEADQSFSEHDKKILANEIAPEWLKAGGFIHLYGWHKILKRRGLKQRIWSPRIKEYNLEDFE